MTAPRTWAQTPPDVRRGVIASLRDDAAMLRGDRPGAQTGRALAHTEALDALADYLDRIEPSIRRQVGR